MTINLFQSQCMIHPNKKSTTASILHP